MRIDAGKAQVLSVHPCPVSPEQLAIRGALLTAAAMVGAMARQLEITIEHANTRKQFGRPLGKFQAVQNLIAGAAAEHAVAQAALSGAVAAEDGGWGRALLWRSAKAQAGRAATIVTAAAHQVLGAIGFTEEHVLHRYSKRLWVWRDDWGRQSALEAAIGEAACADPRGLWPHIVDDAA
jgi:acyl-CoA dehydrogenase